VKLFGYDENHRDPDLDDLEVRSLFRRLGEVTIVPADVEELRRIAAFFSETADLLQQHGEAFGHEHFRDWLERASSAPLGDCDLIVSRQG
jgi:hypothetical protein